MVDIIAGKEEKCFTVHKDLLVSTCDYLRKILYSGANGKRSYIDFKAEDTGAVSLLVTFIYRGSVPTSEEYIAEIKAKEHRISNVKAQNTSSYFPAMKFSVFQPSRPITSQNLSETRSSPFGKLSALAALTVS